MRISTKKESEKMINLLNLNRFPYIHVRGDNKSLVLKFLDKYSNCKFAIRDSEFVMSRRFKNGLNRKDILINYKQLIGTTVTISGLTYIRHKKLTGEICISKDMQLCLSISADPNFSTRDASNNPQFSLMSDIFDKNLNKIPNIFTIIDYILKNHLLDIIVEFSVFDKCVGIKKEKVIIWELRTNY